MLWVRFLRPIPGRRPFVRETFPQSVFVHIITVAAAAAYVLIFTKTSGRARRTPKRGRARRTRAIRWRPDGGFSNGRNGITEFRLIVIPPTKIWRIARTSIFVPVVIFETSLDVRKMYDERAFSYFHTTAKPMIEHKSRRTYATTGNECDR